MVGRVSLVFNGESPQERSQEEDYSRQDQRRGSYVGRERLHTIAEERELKVVTGRPLSSLVRYDLRERRKEGRKKTR